MDERNVPALKSGGLKEIKKWGWDGETLVNHLIAIDYETIEGLRPEDEGTIETWKEVRFDYSETWGILYSDPGEIEGYWSFVPVFPDYFDKLMEGIILEGAITREMIPPKNEKGRFDIYLTTIALREAYRGKGLVQLLYQSFVKAIEAFAEKGVYFNRIGANAYTDAGYAVSTKVFGMQFLRKCPSRGRLMEGNFYPFLQNGILSKNSALTTLYYREFKKGEKR